MGTQMENQSLITKLKAQYKKAQLAYSYGSPVMSDAEFDKMENRIAKLDPNWIGLRKTGVRTKKQKQPLMYVMPSLSKIYPEAVAKNKLVASGKQLIISDKLDGSSVQLVYKEGKPVQLITRGDGTTGQDISYFIPYIHSIPKRISTKDTVVLRLEAVMQKSTFQKTWSKKYDNARNLVAGFLNRKLDKNDKELLAGLCDIDLVVLGKYGSALRHLPKLTDQGFLVVQHVLWLADRPLTSDTLSEILLQDREQSLYEMDGLVISDASHKFGYSDSDRPKWATAFKLNTDDDAADTAIVKDVIWQTSHNGRLTPKIEIDGLQLDGVTIKFCTAHNAQWLTKQKIGPGAVVSIVRSGGVIPKIVKVVSPSKKMKLPAVPYSVKGVHFFVDEQDADIQLKILTRFLVGQGVEHVKLPTVQQIVGSKVPSIPQFLALANNTVRLTQRMNKAGIGPKIQQRIKIQFTKLKELQLFNCMVYSTCFDSLGERKLRAIEAVIPLDKMMAMPSPKIKTTLENVHGFGAKTIAMFLFGLSNYEDLHRELQSVVDIAYTPALNKPATAKEGRLKGQLFSFTGYRSKDEEQAIINNGGLVVPFSAKTTHLLVKDKTSSKVDKAKERGVKVIQFTSLGI